MSLHEIGLVYSARGETIDHEACRVMTQTTIKLTEFKMPVMYLRSISMPMQGHYLAPLKETRALIKLFVKLYPQVWGIYIPGGVTLRIQDAINILPGASSLISTPSYQDLPNKLHLVAQLIQQMKANLQFTINPTLVQQEMRGHNGTFDLLNRAAVNVNAALSLLMNPHVGYSPFTSTVSSAREILAAAMIILQFLDILLQNV